ncbi:hypothetical protein RX327_32145 [Bradyrhizobium sp. BEA-2-5]|uniref:hypothetical protein n=1 Tax=Bradyrhizobium sp. BEA-2-5 TaxID=3080015 RepID=UPI00293F341F|nr:hypothetical protein [Bradyrhizobium sp. BEA-2-5]WOH80406.1 hypothetical protein RX327_32145 [Bradyrhizobium sp. BEA-2-5]
MLDNFLKIVLRPRHSFSGRNRAISEAWSAGIGVACVVVRYPPMPALAGLIDLAEAQASKPQAGSTEHEGETDRSRKETCIDE